MLYKRILATAALIGLAAAPVLAQTALPTSPNRPAVTPPSTTSPPAPQPFRPSATAPAQTQAPAPAPAAPQTPRRAAATPAPTASTPANLNTATAQQLDALPQVGKARTKVILDERAKGRFNDWADFEKRMSGTSVNAGVRAKIKDLVTF